MPLAISSWSTTRHEVPTTGKFDLQTTRSLAFPEPPRDEKTCLKTIFLSLRCFFLRDKFFVSKTMLRDKKIVSETRNLSQRQVSCLTRRKNLSQLFFLSQRRFFLSQRQVFCLRALVHLKMQPRRFLQKLSHYIFFKHIHACTSWTQGPLHRTPCFFLLYLPPSLLCMRYLNRKRLDKATPQAVFLPPLLTEAAASQAPQLSSL
jgi:hypothetical protein